MLIRIFLSLLFISPALATSFDNGIHLSTMMGCSFSGDSPLTLKYLDRPAEIISAKYNNRCFSDSHWWSFRLENWTDQTGWGLELIHHKIYLKNTTDDLKSFSLSDGYNLIFFNLVKQVKDVNFRVGFGGVLGHMDVLISGRPRYIKKGFSGHYLTGPAFQLNVEKILWSSKAHFLSLDTKFTAAYAEVPISANQEELAIAPDYAIHVSLSIGSKPHAFSKNKTAYDKIGYFAPLIYPITVGHLIGTNWLPSGY